jgi:hypothetical protein
MLVLVMVGIAGYEGITFALVFAWSLSLFCRCLSRSFAFVCLSSACLCFRRRPTGIGRAAFCISGVEKFSPTSLYKRRLCT